MPQLRARTIVEAHLYLDLLRVDRLLGEADPGDPAGWTTLTEGPTGWTLHADGAGGAFEPFDIVIAHRDLAEARRTGIRFGPGTSTLIDAGQWRLLAERYAEQAIEAELAAVAAPGNRTLLDRALLAWQFAIDVAGEALRLLPDGVDALPPSAFWTERGHRERRADPHRFTRAALTHQIATYTQLRDDFAEMEGEPDG